MICEECGREYPESWDGLCYFCWLKNQPEKTVGQMLGEVARIAEQLKWEPPQSSVQTAIKEVKTWK